MGYAHIDNLYKYTPILQFREVYVLEKIHGTSAHISWNAEDSKITFFSGGEKHEKFVELFNEDVLKTKFLELFPISNITVFGEAYGGKQQGMSATYGKELKFIAFDVKVGDTWVSVPNAEDIAKKLGLEFVWFEKVECTIDNLNKARERFSEQAKRNGIIEDNRQEGIVIRPLEEMTQSNGKRVIAKHKNDEFMETKTPRQVDPEKLRLIEEARLIADEWVTEMRLKHVLDKLPQDIDISKTGLVIKAMQEDIRREAEGEIIWSQNAEREIGKQSALLFKAFLKNKTLG